MVCWRHPAAARRAGRATMTARSSPKQWTRCGEPTTAFTDEGQAAVFIAVDHCSAECVGIHAHARATPFRGAGADPPGRAPTFRCVRQRDRARPVRPARSRIAIHVRSLPEGNRVPRDGKLAAFVRAPEGNGCAERFIRTLKENLLWLRTFRDNRGTTSGIAGLQGSLQHHLADRTRTASSRQRNSDSSSFNSPQTQLRVRIRCPRNRGRWRFG